MKVKKDAIMNSKTCYHSPIFSWD